MVGGRLQVERYGAEDDVPGTEDGHVDASEMSMRVGVTTVRNNIGRDESARGCKNTAKVIRKAHGEHSGYEDRGSGRTFASDTAHSRLLWLLAHGELVIPVVVRTHEYGLLRMKHALDRVWNAQREVVVVRAGRGERDGERDSGGEIHNKREMRVG